MSFLPRVDWNENDLDHESVTQWITKNLLVSNNNLQYFKFILTNILQKGNNLFGDGIPKFLRGIASASERNAYILMERINAVTYESYLLSTSSFKLDKFVAELSDSGFFWRKFYNITLQISNTTNVIANVQAQHWSQTCCFSHIAVFKHYFI